MANAGEGQTSGATDQNIELQQWLKSIVEGDPIILHPQKAKIPKVPPVLREVESNKTCYDPQVVSIGPYHHGKSYLKDGEHFKTAVASYFIQNSGKSVDEMFNKVLEVSEKARMYYVNRPGTVTFNDNKQFARIMFLDGCFLLQYMCCFIDDFQWLHMMGSHSTALIAQDLLMVENQLPSTVIDALLAFVPGGLQFSILLVTFIYKMYGSQMKFRSLLKDRIIKEDHLHLLDVFRKLYLGPKKDAKQLGKFDEHDWSEEISFRSAKELQSVGVRFKAESSAFPADIRFSSHLISAFLTLPKITIDTSTKTIFLNVLAYEISKDDDPGDNRFTDFVCFMGSLIDHVDDVKILRSSGVLNHSLGSDKQVADLFNHIGKNLIPSYDAYWMVKKGIEERYKSKSSLWLAEMWYCG